MIEYILIAMEIGIALIALIALGEALDAHARIDFIKKELSELEIYINRLKPLKYNLMALDCQYLHLEKLFKETTAISAAKPTPVNKRPERKPVLGRNGKK